MKKIIIALLIPALILAGWFFWKGGHHALALAQILEDWLDADSANQSLSVQITQPEQSAFSADTFWTEYAERTIFGVSVQGITAYTDGKILYMDTGKAYTLPELSALRESGRRLALGMLLYGRITKNEDTYHITVKSGELELDCALTADPALQTFTIKAVLPDKTALTLSMRTKPATPHPIPREVADAMVQARIAPPMPLSEPLEVLLPALKGLLPLQGDLTLGVECGILKLKETVLFRMNRTTAEVEQKGAVLSIDLPASFSGTDPALLGILLLRSGTYAHEDGTARFQVILSGEFATGLLEALVPQAAALGIRLESSILSLQIQEGRLSVASIFSEGSVPFLITTIPVDFSAELRVS